MQIAPTFAWTPDDPHPQPLWQALGRQPGGVVTLVGAGGKTTLAHTLAHTAAATGTRVLLTTTTKMGHEDGLITDPDAVLAALQPGRVVLAGGVRGSEKFGAFAPDVLDRLRKAADVTVIEGDGARKLPFKVPAAHEPVVPDYTDLLIVVAGLTALGRPLGEITCRAAEASELLNDPDAATRPLDPPLAARLLREGFLANPKLAAWAGRRVVALNQADTPPLAGRGVQLAAGLPGARVLLTSNRAQEQP